MNRSNVCLGVEILSSAEKPNIIIIVAYDMGCWAVVNRDRKLILSKQFDKIKISEDCLVDYAHDNCEAQNSMSEK